MNHNQEGSEPLIMKSITIHNLEPELEKGITAEAKRLGLSLNKTIKKLLRDSMNLSPEKKSGKKADFSDLAGTWTQEEYDEFEKNTAIFEKIDEEMWK